MAALQESKIDVFRDFKSEILESSRGVYVYLPKGYDPDGDKQYPVVYMHAGQRVFPIAKRLPSWNVQDTLDRLIANGDMEPVVVVAIAFLKVPKLRVQRMDYMYPYDRVLKGIGMLGMLPQYSRFIIDEILPFVEKNYRVIADKSGRTIFGSSSGATASYHIAMENPEYFSRCVMMSPMLYVYKSRWLSRICAILKVHMNFKKISIFRYYPRKADVSFWIDLGDKEHFFPPSEVRGFVKEMMVRGYSYGQELFFHIQKDAMHFEIDWGERAHLPFLHFFGTAKGKKSMDVRDGLLIEEDKPELKLAD